VKTVMVKVAPAKSMPITKPVQTAALAAQTPAPASPAPQPQISARAMPVVQPDPNAPPMSPPGARPGVLGVLPASAVNKPVTPAGKAARKPTPRKGWAIQIGAFEEESEAKQRLGAAQAKAAALLGKADSYTERTSRGPKTYYRARFVVGERNQAEAACKQLKRSDISCMALKL
jgi:D-alanyl-D-alanine carboxypeptidase